MKDINYFLAKLNFKFSLDPKETGDPKARLLSGLLIGDKDRFLQHNDIVQYLTLVEELIQEIPPVYFNGPKDSLKESLIQKTLTCCPAFAKGTNLYYINVIELIMKRTPKEAYNQEEYPLVTALKLGVPTDIIKQFIILSEVTFTKREGGLTPHGALESASVLLKQKAFSNTYEEKEIPLIQSWLTNRYDELKPKGEAPILAHIGLFANKVSTPQKPKAAQRPAPKPSPRPAPRRPVKTVPKPAPRRQVEAAPKPSPRPPKKAALLPPGFSRGLSHTSQASLA